VNAYELANELENKDRLWNVDENLMLKNCAMLRQQADRIAELEKECNWAKDQWNKDRICFEASKTELEKDLALKTRDRDVFREFTLAYEKRIAELEKSIQDGIQSFGVLQEQMLKEKLFGAEPVAWIAYDEFGDFMLEATKEGDYPWQPLYTTPQIKELSDEEIIELFEHPDDFNCIDFARAILKKASEK
jgi:hypothetical protein